MADGGDGLLDVLSTYRNCERRTIEVSDPLFRRIKASYLITEDGTAFIEMAKASGLLLLNPGEYNPAKTSTYGTGELIKDAISQKVNKIVLGIGGSATNDGGIGMAAALGFRFVDNEGNELAPVGENLIHISRIENPVNCDFKAVCIELACDVTNPLIGEQGAARVFARQKGADDTMVAVLEKGLQHFSELVAQQMNKDIAHIPGAGAAGGLGAACIAFLNADLKQGIQLVFEYSKIEDHIKQADLVISGEGKLDEQSLQGKVVSGISSLCQKYDKPLYVLCGKNELNEVQHQEAGINKVFSLFEMAGSEQESMHNAAFWLKEMAENLQL